MSAARRVLVLFLPLFLTGYPRGALGQVPAADNEALEPVGRVADGTSITPVNQRLHPTGRQVELPGMRPQAIALSPDGVILVTSGKTNEVVVVDPDSGTILDRVKPAADDVREPAPAGQPPRNLAPDTKAIESYTGLVFSPDGTRLAMSNVHGSVKIFTVDGRTVTASHTLPLPAASAPGRAAEIPAGLAWSAGGERLYVCGNLSNRLLEIDTRTGETLRTFEVGVAPFDVVLAGGRALVSNLGGRRPGPDDLVGPAGKGTTVRVDPVRHIAAGGSVSVVDLATGAVAEVPTGKHASALAVSPDGRHVACANAGDDTLSILDVASGTLVGTVGTKATPAELFGAQPAALAFAADGSRLFVANAAQNAIGVIEWDPLERGGTRLVGLIPVGWHPSGVVHDARRGMLHVANMKGLPSTPRPRGDGEAYNSHQHQGSLSLVEIPDDEGLRHLSEVADRAMRAAAIRAAFLPARADAPPRAIPERIGEPSLIEHVVYVIKENRTYDQVLGDLPGGNGRADLCIYGADVTPNQHAIASRYVLLDNAYCCGILSADGHNWSTAATTTDWLERSFAGFPRAYPDGMEDADADALSWSPAGFIWDRAVEAGLSIRNYGEFMMPRVRWRDPARAGRPDFAACLAAWRAGPDRGEVLFASEPAIESIRPFSAADTVGWNMSVPDQFRADAVIRELAEYERRGTYPRLVIVCLPNDHTSGATPGCPVPAACVADNDVAFGRIVEALSRSRFWPKMAVFAVEDDPQDGWDHVSGYRTTFYVASPWARKGVTVSTRYNTTSVLRTIGQILGLRPMNHFDASATPMFDCFADESDAGPFTALPAGVPLDRMNGVPQSLADPALRDDALASQRMDFEGVDRAPEDALNRILWRAAKGSRIPYPEWAVSAADEEDDDD